MRNLLVILSLSLSTTLLAQETSAPMELSLTDAVQYAWKNSQKAKTSQIDIEQAQKDVWIQVARGLPQVNGSFGFNNFLDIPTSVVDGNAFNPPGIPDNPNAEPIPMQFGQPYTMEAGINVGMQLFDGSYIIGVKGAKGFQKMSHDLGKMTQNEIETIIAEAYYTSQIAGENAGLLEQSISNMEKTLGETSALYKEGFAEEMDVEQLDLLINGLKNKLQMAKRQHEATLYLLKYQMGLPIDTKIVLTDNLETLWGLQSNDELLTMDLSMDDNLAFDLVKQDVVLHGYLVQLEKAKYFPRLNAFFDYKHQAFRDKFDFFDGDKSWYPQTLWGIQLSVPIWDNLGGVASIKKAKLEQQKVKNKLADLEQALIMQAKIAKDDFTSALEGLENSKQNIDLASRIKEKMLIKYNEGLATSMELTTAENQLIQAQSDYIMALFNAMDAKMEMKKVLENN